MMIVIRFAFVSSHYVTVMKGLVYMDYTITK